MKKEIIDLLKTDTATLAGIANEVRKEYKGDFVHLRGLLEFSNVCSNNCFYCGLRRDNSVLPRYMLTKEEILNCCKAAAQSGIKTVVLQSGESKVFDTGELCEIISEIKKYDLAITLSIGEKTKEEYAKYRASGADRYLLRIETTDKELYAKLHPGMSFENRVKCLYNLKELGYETGTGVIAGLPGQTIESLANDISFFKETDADMIGIGPLIPHPQTPLKDAPSDNFDIALKVMAATRIITKDTNIPATTAMETIKPDGRIIALNSGANVVMPNITSREYRKKYEIYPGKICTDEHPGDCINCIKGKILSIGRKVSTTKGFRTDKNQCK